MSGHSHFSTIKRAKEITDKKRGKIFSKLIKMISMAAKDGLPDPNVNPKLRMAVERAKEANMPKDNIERAIKKGSGGLAGEKLEEVVFEAFGPAGIALIITGITDNKNRMLGEVKQILNQSNGKMAGEGAVKWMFERKGVIAVNTEGQNISKEDLEMKAIEAGAQDTNWHESSLDIYTKPEELDSVKKNLEQIGIESESSSLDFVAKEEVELEEKQKESANKLFEVLDENDDVQDIYSNIKS
jgi:YebC/PmpR family DNA-binding regulatory protein